MSPFTSHCTCPGSRIRPAGKVVPRITRSTCAAIASSLPTPFCTEATLPSANAWAVASIAAAVCMHFVATIPKSQAGSSAASVVARRRPVDLARAGEPQPVAVDRVDVRAVEVVRPDLDVVEPGQVRREQRPDGAAADDAHPHAYDSSLAFTSRSTAVSSGASTPAPLRLPRRARR